jgi:hypothetical protein
MHDHTRQWYLPWLVICCHGGEYRLPGPSHPPSIVAMPPSWRIPPIGPRKPSSTVATPPDVAGDLLLQGPSKLPPMVAMPPEVVGDLLPRGRAPPSAPSRTGNHQPPRKRIPPSGASKQPSMEEMVDQGNRALLHSGVNETLVNNAGMNTQRITRCNL